MTMPIPIAEIVLAAIVGLLVCAWVGLRRQRIRIRQAFQAERDRIDVWIESSPVGLIVFNEAREIVRLNAEAARLLRREALDAFGNRHGEAFQCVHWRESPKGCGYSSSCLICPIRQTITKVLDEKKSVRAFEAPMTVVCEGTVQRVWLRIGAQPFSVKGCPQVIVSLDDITASVQTVERLKQVTDELARLNEKIEQVSEAKWRFLAHMSHEIRTPLNGVIGMADLLENTTMDAQQREYLRHLHASAEILLDVVNGILDFSKLEAAKMTLERASFNLHDCLDEVAQVVGPAAARKKLELVFQVDPGVPALWVGDALRLRQILVNLVANAVKFTERGEVVVTVSCGERRADDGRLDFAVRDTGVGISSEQQRRLFEPFNQADGGAAKQLGGTGLGLAISKQLCELMGGGIAVESGGVPGRGSVFRFSVRLASGGDPCVSDGSVAHVSLPGKKVLVVDDNAASAKALSRYLEAWGMTAQSESSGGAALARLRSGERFDVTLTDSEMPDMEGRALAHEMAVLEEADRSRVVLLCPPGGEITVDEQRRCRISACVAKPVNPRRLHDALVAALATARRDEAGAFSAASPAAAPEAVSRLPLRILVAEDNVVNQKVVLGYLSNMGYAADVVADGQDAVDAVKKRVYDLVLLDGQMPEMNGEEAAALIRKEVPAERQPWIVAMTANVLKGDRERYLAAGMNDYLAKPIRTQKLREVLNGVPIVSG